MLGCILAKGKAPQKVGDAVENQCMAEVSVTDVGSLKKAVR